MIVSWLLVPVALFGDAPENGTVEGTVQDAAGGALPGVTVILSGGRGDRSEQTDEAGSYRFVLLAPGEYTVSAALEGFDPVETTVQVESGVRKVVDLRLGLDVGETISVLAEAALVDKYEVSSAATIEAAVAQEIAFEGRNYQSVTNMMPGVVQIFQSQNLADHRPSVNGNKFQENGGFIDGVDTSAALNGGSSRIILPTTAVAEVRMEGAGYGVEYGRVTGGVTSAVIKSGSNRFHGELLYLAQNPAWREEIEVLPGFEHPDDLENNYEVSLGGPIVRDKAWFFASASDNDANRWTQTLDGATVSNAFISEAKLLKLNAQPAESHQLSLLAVDAPTDLLGVGPFSGDVYVPTLQELSEELYTASWSWSASRSMFLEVRAARHDSREDRSVPVRPTIVPGASPDSPNGNQSTYQDQGAAIFYNGTFHASGFGFSEFPRDQANASLTMFRGSQEYRFGVDYQEVGLEAFRDKPPLYQGQRFDRNLPSGFVTPTRKRVFMPAEASDETTSENAAAYAQGRFSSGDHWVFTVGLRLEDQTHENDLGQTAVDSTDLAPRVAAAYDVKGDGRLLIKGTLGRYYHHIIQELTNSEFSTRINGVNAFTDFRYNPATQRYDILISTTVPSQTQIQDFEPYFKDEAMIGVEWQFQPLWALKARGIYWVVDDLYSATNQINASGAIFRFVGNVPEAERKYRGLQLELNRAFRDQWLLRTNYTLGRVQGNFFGETAGSLIDDDFLEAQAIIDPATGQPFTENFRYGRGPQDVTHLVNVAGAKNWSLGSHTLQLGGLYSYNSGVPWGLRPALNLTAPAGGIIATTRYIEERDSNELPDTFSLSLNTTWFFPITSRIEGTVRAEVANVTNEQAATQISLANGMITPTNSNYQRPREYRFLAGIRF